MKRLLAIAASSLLILTGCASEPEFGEVSSAIQDSQEMQTEAEAGDLENDQNGGSIIWPSCDSEDAQPLTQIIDKDFRVFASNCATDRTASTPALLRTDLEGNDIEPCMIQENSYSRNTYGDYIIGAFPRAVVLGNWPAKIELTMVVVPMDWPDFPGQGSPLKQIIPAVEFTENFYTVFSRGNVTFNWRIYDEWITAPDESANYFVSQEEMQDEHGAMRAKAEEYFPKVIEFTDPYIDYSDADLVLYVWPEEQDLFTQYIMWDTGEHGVGPFASDEGLIKQAFTGGRFHFVDGHGGLGPFWAHEMGHAFGLPDLNWNELDGLRNNGDNLPGSFNGYDLMAGFDATRTMSAWLMFLADWLGPNESFCLPQAFDEGSFEIFPVTDTRDNLKSVMIPIDERFQIVIEGRRLSQFDVSSAFKTRSREGVLIYLVDATRGQGEGTQVLIAPPGRGLYMYSIENSWRTDQLDGMFYEGNTVDIAGYRITVNEFRQDRDVVSVSKIGKEEIRFGNYVCITEENRDRSRDYEEYCPLEALLPWRES